MDIYQHFFLRKEKRMNNYDSICCFSNDSSTESRVCWELLTQCNLNCFFCHRYKQDNSKYDYSNIDRTLSVLRKNKIAKVIISGGEPLLHPFFFSIVDILKENGFRVDLCTNAYYFDEEKTEKISERFDEVSISIDSYTKKRHDEIRGCVGAFDQTIRNVKNLIKKGVVIHSTTLVTVDMIEDIPKIILFLKSLGITSMSFIGYIPFNTGINELLQEDKQVILKELFNRIRLENKDLQINTKQIITNEKMRCEAGHLVYGLGVDGINLHPCLLLRDREKKQSFENGMGCCPGSKKYTK